MPPAQRVIPHNPLLPAVAQANARGLRALARKDRQSLALHDEFPEAGARKQRLARATTGIRDELDGCAVGLVFFRKWREVHWAAPGAI